MTGAGNGFEAYDEEPGEEEKGQAEQQGRYDGPGSPGGPRVLDGC